MEEYGTRLKKERERLGLSQVGLAEVCGVTSQSQLNYEKGLRYPNAEYLMRFSEVGGDAQYVLTGKRGSDTSPVEQITNPRILELSEAQQQMVNQLIDELANGNKQKSVVKRVAKEINELSK